MSDISQSFFDSFGGYSGVGATVLEVPGRFPVAIGTHAYVIDLAKYDRQMLPITRQGADTGAEPGEQSLNNEGVWLRFGRNWEHGAGQTEWDMPDKDRLRFLRSLGADVWTPNQVSNLHGVADMRDSEAGQTPLVLAVGGYLYVVRKTGGVQVVQYTADEGSNWSAEVTGMGTVNALCGDGTRVWFATSTGLWYKAYGTTGAATQAVAATLNSACQAVGLVNGHLLVGKGATLYEVDSAIATAVALYTHWQGSFTWDTIFAGPSYVYAGGHVSDHTECYRFGVDPVGGALVKGAPAFTLEVGELLRTALFVTSVVVLATSRGLRLGTFNAGGGIDYGPLITAPGDCRCLASDSGFVWFGWSDYDADHTGLGRLKLGTFTDTLVPAYASDIMQVGQGTVTAVCRLNGLTWFAVEADGIFKENTTAWTNAILETGWITYGTVQRKTTLDVSVKHSSLAAGQLVRVEATDGWAFNQMVGQSEEDGSNGNAVPMRINRTGMERIGLTFTLVGNANSITMDRWELRSLPAPAEREDRIVVPILMGDQVSSPWTDGKFEAYDPLAEWEYLVGLAESGEVVPYTEGVSVYDARVLRLQVREPDDWDHRRQFFQGVFLVELQVIR